MGVDLRGRCEVNVLRLDGARRLTWRRLVCPVQVGVRNDQLWCGSTPLGLVFCSVSVAHQHGVVAAYERSVKSRTDARVALGADDEQTPNALIVQHALE